MARAVIAQLILIDIISKCASFVSQSVSQSVGQWFCLMIGLHIGFERLCTIRCMRHAAATCSLAVHCLLISQRQETNIANFTQRESSPMCDAIACGLTVIWVQLMFEISVRHLFAIVVVVVVVSVSNLDLARSFAIENICDGIANHISHNLLRTHSLSLKQTHSNEWMIIISHILWRYD